MLASPALAADVTPDRLANTDKGAELADECRTYDAQRYSPLARITKDNVKASSSPMRFRSAAPPSTSLQATRCSGRPMYIVDQWGAVYKADVMRRRRRIVWRWTPARRKHTVEPRRGAVGQSGCFGRQLSGARDWDRQGHRQIRGKPMWPMVRPICSSPLLRSP
jgi:hypothetical protein